MTWPASLRTCSGTWPQWLSIQYPFRASPPARWTSQTRSSGSSADEVENASVFRSARWSRRCAGREGIPQSAPSATCRYEAAVAHFRRVRFQVVHACLDRQRSVDRRRHTRASSRTACITPSAVCSWGSSIPVPATWPSILAVLKLRCSLIQGHCRASLIAFRSARCSSDGGHEPADGKPDAVQQLGHRAGASRSSNSAPTSRQRALPGRALCPQGFRLDFHEVHQPWIAPDASREERRCRRCPTPRRGGRNDILFPPRWRASGPASRPCSTPTSAPDLLIEVRPCSADILLGPSGWA